MKFSFVVILMFGEDDNITNVHLAALPFISCTKAINDSLEGFEALKIPISMQVNLYVAV